METTVKKDELLAILNENRSKHREVFDAAWTGYQETAIRILQDELDALKGGRVRELRILLSRPEDHTRDYDRIIRMLELDTSETFTLSEQRFAQYVMDDWDWKRSWLKMSNQYASASTQKAYGVIKDEDDA